MWRRQVHARMRQWIIQSIADRFIERFGSTRSIRLRAYRGSLLTVIVTAFNLYLINKHPNGDWVKNFTSKPARVNLCSSRTPKSRCWSASRSASIAKTNSNNHSSSTNSSIRKELFQLRTVKLSPLTDNLSRSAKSTLTWWMRDPHQISPHQRVSSLSITNQNIRNPGWPPHLRQSALNPPNRRVIWQPLQAHQSSIRRLSSWPIKELEPHISQVSLNRKNMCPQADYPCLCHPRRIPL